MDIENVMAAWAVEKDQLDKAKVMLERYEARIIELEGIAKVLEQKTIEAQQDANQMRLIMTQNITESNQKINEYVENIKNLQATVRGLKAELNGDIS